MKKRKIIIANGVTALIIIGIIGAGLLGVGYIRGWFGDTGSDAAVLADVRGIVNMTRNGVTYPVEQDTPLRKDDALSFTPGATATIRIGNGSAVAIGEYAALVIVSPDVRNFTVSMLLGDLFAIVRGNRNPVTIRYELGKEPITVTDAVISFSAQKGAQTLNVFAGGKSLPASVGERIEYMATARPAISVIPITSLNAFTIAQLRGANAVTETCFSDAELDQLEAERKAEQEAASLASMSEALSELDLACECTLSIRCDTILDHYDDLDPAKAEFVPDDGVILATVKVPFAEGETAFDATKRACEAYGLQIEYSWTPLYNSYYVEGINYLYEFDCGAESGWMFKVNGWFPNYGASSYVLQDGDAIMWEYTCVGLGTDIGGNGW